MICAWLIFICRHHKHVCDEHRNKTELNVSSRSLSLTSERSHWFSRHFKYFILENFFLLGVFNLMALLCSLCSLYIGSVKWLLNNQLQFGKLFNTKLVSVVLGFIKQICLNCVMKIECFYIKYTKNRQINVFSEKRDSYM